MQYGTIHLVHKVRVCLSKFWCCAVLSWLLNEYMSKLCHERQRCHMKSTTTPTWLLGSALPCSSTDSSMCAVTVTSLLARLGVLLSCHHTECCAQDSLSCIGSPIHARRGRAAHMANNSTPGKQSARKRPRLFCIDGCKLYFELRVFSICTHGESTGQANAVQLYIN